MPIYEYECLDCKEEWETYHTVDTRLEETCAYCSKKASMLMSVQARPIIEEYYSENLGAVVTGPKHRKELMKQKGLEER